MAVASEYATALESGVMNRPINTLAQRLKMARVRRNLTQGQLALAAGLKQPDVSKIELGRIQQTTAIARLASALNVSAAWLEQGHPPEPDWAYLQYAPAGVVIPTVAQEMSHAALSYHLPEITWESLMGNVPESLFVLHLRDDALAPDHPAGCAVVWSKHREPKPGRLVLVRDKHGVDHARVYHQGRAPGDWLAAATNRAFADFHPVDDGLQIIAVHRGVLEQADEGEPLSAGRITRRINT
jgi:transcriptional regulator with XRE-family HTH domain